MTIIISACMYVCMYVCGSGEQEELTALRPPAVLAHSCAVIFRVVIIGFPSEWDGDAGDHRHDEASQGRSCQRGWNSERIIIFYHYQYFCST